MFPDAELTAINSTIDRIFFPKFSPRIRLFERRDIRLIEAMSAELSSRSLYQRFFVGTPAIPAALLRQLANIDHDTHEAVVALVGEQAVGLAQYVRPPRAASAELAVLVADAWQRRGVGRSMIACLAERAAAHGVTRFEADVLSDNEPARLGIARLWPGALGAVDEDSIAYELPLSDSSGTSTASTLCRRPGAR